MASAKQELLAAMAEQWTVQTVMMIDLAVACALVKAGQRSVTISTADMKHVMAKYQVVRTREDGSDGTAEAWTISLIPYGDEI